MKMTPEIEVALDQARERGPDHWIWGWLKNRSKDADKKSTRSTTGLHIMKPGLYLYCTPSSDSIGVLRVAWIRPAPGQGPDEYEAVNSTTPRRGEYTTMLVDAEDAPPSHWTWTKCLKRPSPLHRAQIRHPVALDEKGYSKVCPKPKDW